MEQIILGIETSCDDTSIAVLRSEQNSALPWGAEIEILFHKTFNQDDSLAYWGGIVPELAARNHLGKIPQLLHSALKSSDCSPQDITCIAVTTKPGLLGPLLTGINAAKTLSLINRTSIFPVNHLHAHIEAIHLSEKVDYPYIGLVVSGGHSAFFLVRSGHDFISLASTMDDAAGEAFDKGGKLMGLTYPAGRIIDQLAQWGNPQAIDFPRGLTKDKSSPNMSFSGIKNSLRLYLQKNPVAIPAELSSRQDQFQSLYDLCASYRESIVETLLLKAQQIHAQYSDLPLVVGGGVACNSRLRELFQKQFSRVFIVRPEFCTDNGAMVANLAMRNPGFHLKFPQCLDIDAQSRAINKMDFIQGK